MIVQDAKPRPSGTRAKRRPSDQALVTAAVLIEEQVPDADIAAAFGVSRRTLNRWKRYPEMQLLARAFLVQWTRQHWKQAGKVSRGAGDCDREHPASLTPSPCPCAALRRPLGVRA